MIEPFTLTATEAITAIKAGTLKAETLIRSCCDHIRKIEPKLHAWVIYDEMRAIRRAQEIDRAIAAGTFDGSLYGVPVGIKDIYNTMDFPTQMGSPIWKGFTPNNDSRSVFYLREAGAVILGKTVTAEFAVHEPGPTVNPHNPEYMTGTSSSGSAVAVAANMVPIATGSQTAGSTIRPASYNGVYGFKATFGMVPRTGVLKTVDVLDHVTMFGRSIEDVELAFEVMRVKGIDHPLVEKFLDAPGSQKQGPWKLAFVRTHLWDQWEPYGKQAIIEYVEKLRQQGIEVEEAVLPGEFQLAHEIHRVIYNKALSYYYKEECADHADMLSPVFHDMLLDGQKITNDEYRVMCDKQIALGHLLDDFLDRYDGIITLSTAGEAKKGHDAVDTIDSCLIWTMCGVPSINLPVFTGPNRLPFGAQLVFRKYQDHSLFSCLRDLKAAGLIRDIRYAF
jgi:Asp-tRNA(Asn)/Glu-tRNA(Gln) amidotransferase A subunit family amidase